LANSRIVGGSLAEPCAHNGDDGSPWGRALGPGAPPAASL